MMAALPTPRDREEGRYISILKLLPDLLRLAAEGDVMVRGMSISTDNSAEAVSAKLFGPGYDPFAADPEFEDHRRYSWIELAGSLATWTRSPDGDRYIPGATAETMYLADRFERYVDECIDIVRVATGRIPELHELDGKVLLVWEDR